MQFPSPLTAGILLRRYKRFLADVRLDTGEDITAHCANPGSMLGLKEPGQRVWLSKSNNPKRKLPYSWVLTKVKEAFVGIDTSYPNKLVEEAIKNGTIQELQGYDTLQREVRYGQNSRIDLLLKDTSSKQKPDCYVEVKNVHLLRTPKVFEFPDSVTTRGSKHLQEMTKMVEQGARAVMVYLIQRDDGDLLRFASDIDPVYANCFKQARAAGVEAIAYACQITPESIFAHRAVPIEMP